LVRWPSRDVAFTGTSAAAHIFAREQAIGEAHAEILGEDIEGRFHALEREEKVDALLTELKQRKRLSA